MGSEDSKISTFGGHAFWKIWMDLSFRLLLLYYVVCYIWYESLVYLYVIGSYFQNMLTMKKLFITISIVSSVGKFMYT